MPADFSSQNPQSISHLTQQQREQFVVDEGDLYNGRFWKETWQARDTHCFSDLTHARQWPVFGTIVNLGGKGVFTDNYRRFFLSLSFSQPLSTYTPNSTIRSSSLCPGKPKYLFSGSLIPSATLSRASSPLPRAFLTLSLNLTPSLVLLQPLPSDPSVQLSILFPTPHHPILPDPAFPFHHLAICDVFQVAYPI